MDCYPGLDSRTHHIPYPRHPNRPLHLPPLPLCGNDGDEGMDGTMMGVQAADLRELATDYAAFVGALRESLGGLGVLAVVDSWIWELGKWGAFSLEHAQVSRARSSLAESEAWTATYHDTYTSTQTRPLWRRSQAGVRCGRGYCSA